MKNKTLNIFLAACLSFLFLSACSGGGGGGNDDLLTELTATTETACADGLDDDSDGLVDCADSDCALDANCAEAVAKAEVCTGGLDEDGDGLVDCDDTVDCAADAVACPPAALEVAVNTETACADELDDDSDGKIDCEDGDCEDSPDCEEDEQNGAEKEPDGTKEYGLGLSATDKAVHRNSAGPSALKMFTQVSAGFHHTCGVKNDGSVWCWGDGEYGQLGIGDTADKDTPVQVSGLADFKQVSAGFHHTCGVKNDGSVWCWGDGEYGQLGIGDTADKDTPVQIFNSAGFTQVSAGGTYAYGHTCGVKEEDGTVWCWGSNFYGQLGIGDTADKDTPVQLSGLADFKQVSAGYVHTCGVKNDGTVWCWGWGGHGQLGNLNMWIQEGPLHQVAPVKVSDSADFTQVSAGAGHTCGVKEEDGTVWCWGDGEYGQLGNNDDYNNKFTPVQVSNSTGFTQVSAGAEHTCGVKNDGTAWCWGHGTHGRLGSGNTNNRDTPYQVVDSADFKQVSAGNHHTCGVKENGAAWCWGGNGHGQLGDGNRHYTYGESTPVQVKNSINLALPVVPQR